MDSKIVKIDLGGGSNPRGIDWINVDRQHTDHFAGGISIKPDVVVDFDSGDFVLPFADASVDVVYSAHCLEHVRNLRGVMREIVRVCKISASVEIRVPSPGATMAMCYGHVHVIPDEQVEHWCKTHIPYWFAGCERRLHHLSTERINGTWFAEARQLFSHLSNDQIMRFVPGTCCEHRYYFTVVPYAPLP